MRDVTDRDRIASMVHRKLADRDFRQRLKAAAPDGTHPIEVALPDDPFAGLVRRILSLGGAANVVVPRLNGFVVVAMEVEHAGAASDRDRDVLREDSTVGVVVARMHIDGPEAQYAFQLPVAHERGSVELVAVGG